MARRAPKQLLNRKCLASTFTFFVMFSCFCVISGWRSVHKGLASTFMGTVCFMFSYFTGLHQKSISLNTFPLALASRFQIAVPWKRKCQYFQLMYLFKGQMKFLSQTESPIVRYVQQNLLPQVLFSHKCCHATFKNVFIVTIEKREKC